MKHFIVVSLLVILSTISFSQQTMPAHGLTTQEYLQKSKHQRNTGWILVGGGLVLEIAGVIAYQSGNASIFLLGAGLLSQVASIPFFVSAAINNNKSKKASLSFKLQRSPGTHMSAINFRPQPAISVKLNF